ncbi:MAG: hybrid sensor histidine kinase/response regulator [Polyangiaceae bacterium]|nr:hybrid sensor histidine kinase/response regulator [Polyangiaceae bacterium]
MPRILHIEDDPRNRLLVRKLLVSEGMEVIDAADGIEGVRLAIEKRPDLVLVDINIPGLDGYEVTLRLRSDSALSGVPIVAITAEGDRDTSFAVGCTGFIPKPIDVRTFGRQVRQYVGGLKEISTVSPDATGERLRVQSGRIVQHLEAKIAELSAANDRLRDMERLRAEFYRNISHELATPLTPIVGYTKMLLDNELGSLDPTQKKVLRAMDECIKRLRNTLDNLIDVTSLETGRMRFAHRKYDFLACVQYAIAAVSPAFQERGQHFSVELPEGDLPGYGDPDRIQRALVQLLDNASKFSPERTYIGMAVWETAAAFELVVADSGPGVPANQIERIFEPFYQVDGSPTRAQGGVGVGLAIVRKIARGHGGDTRVEQGATIGNVYYPGAVFAFSIAKQAPSVTIDTR